MQEERELPGRMGGIRNGVMVLGGGCAVREFAWCEGVR